jgi:murein DD-endopeptidase MepM/ murein hydrolase activator NlpD
MAFSSGSGRVERKPYSVSIKRRYGMSMSKKRASSSKSWMERLMGFFSAIGEGVCRQGKTIGRGACKVYDVLFRRFGRRVAWRIKKLGIRLRYFVRQTRLVVSVPFLKTAHAVGAVRTVMGQTVGQPWTQRFGAVRHELWVRTKRNKAIFATLVNYALPVLGVCLFFYVVNFAGSLTFAVAVSYNDTELGYVSNEAVAEQAKQIVQGRMVYLNDSERVDIVPTYSVEIAQDTDMMTEYQLADKIISLSSDDMVEAEGLYVDGTFYGAIEDKGYIQDELNAVLDSYRSDDETEEVSFVNDVQVVSGLYLTDNIVSAETITAQITGANQQAHYYTTSDGDTAGFVAKVNNITFDQLKQMNSTVTMKTEKTTLPEGTSLMVEQADPFLPVQITRTVTYTETVDFEIEKTESSKYMKGTEKITQKGVEGENEVTAKVSYVNNVEVSREVLSTKVIKEPVSQKVTVGTASMSSASLEGSTGSGKINSGFIWPINGYVSSGYGYRSMGYHGGLDICLPGGTYGASVHACAAGTVVFAGWSGTYGKLVKIDHGNGLQTWYAHNSELLVSVGDVVGQGETISKAGATGYVTGPHVHLEVRVNGIRKNPINYLP